MDAPDVSPVVLQPSNEPTAEDSPTDPPATSAHIPTPVCENMAEHPDAPAHRAALNALLAVDTPIVNPDALTTHLLHGLAHTVGSALGATPPTEDECLAAFTAPSSVGLSAGARARSKHAHRSSAAAPASGALGKADAQEGWWGTPAGPVASLNARALALFTRVVHGATWRNLHWLPHGVLVYEVRVRAGYGMRWARDLGGLLDARNVLRADAVGELGARPWTFRGFVEPMMENGHEVGWRH